ncbi:hypothetical protein C4J81_17490 [Deltaproteobacteria bacterium Smac51]|nr:hypothetical protein C4J81_17490 [Deltaproteobacteria bacterium Smac51]
MSGFSPNPSQKLVMECRDQLCVIAGAGSGKTGTLVETVVKRLADSLSEEKPFSIQELLALTFTEKAAAELRWRLGRAFWQKALSRPEEGPFWRKEAARLDRADIGTIHGYALKLVRENALSLGLAASIQIDGNNLSFERDFNNTITDWLDEDDQDLGWLLDRMSSAHLSGILSACATRFSSWGLSRLSADTDAPEVSELTLNDFRALVKSGLELVENGDLNKSKPYYEKVRSAMLRLNEAVSLLFEEFRVNPAQHIALWQRLIKESGDWFSKRGRLMKKELEATAAALKAANDAFLSVPVKERILRLAHQLPRRLDSLKRRRGAINFDDILILARRLLATNPMVRQKEIKRRRLILIDEFQDTNRLQANLLAYLLLNPDDDRVFPEDYELWRNMPWAEAAPRLNVFGDLKQSIYRFRGAEVEVMAGLRDALSQGCGAVLALDYNYRSQGPLIDFFNKLFQSHLGAASFTEHDAQNQVRPALYDGPQVNLVIPGEERPARADDRAWAQAAALVRYLGELFSGQRGVLVDDGRGGGRVPGPGDVAILFRQAKRALVFRESLLKAGWKCQTAFGDNPFNYAEVKALLAAFKYLGGVDEEISLAGALRSPLGPVSDAALLALARPAGEDRPVKLTEYFTGERQWPELSAEDLQTLNGLKSLFSSLAPLVGRMPPVEILERLVEERRLIPSALLEPDGEERARAITLFLAASRSVGDSGDSLPLGPAEELDELARNWDSSRRGGDERLDPGAIKLMTVHGSKGLEFPIVIIAEADRAARARSSPVIISRDGVLAVRFTDDNGQDIKPADYLSLKEEEDALEREEDGRLLYVAATRAKDHLAFLGWPRQSKRKPESRASWFETVSECEAIADGLGLVQYEAAETGELLAANEDKEETAAGPQALEWPLELLPPMRPHSQNLAVTSLSALLVSPGAFYNEYHLGLKRGFDWRPGTDEPFFQFHKPAVASATEPQRRLTAAEAGTLFHAVLEKVNLEDPRPRVCLHQEAELMMLNPSEDEMQSLAKSLDDFLSGPVGRLWRDCRLAGLAEYRELAFSLTVPGPAAGDVLNVSGRIDLFHCTPDGGGRIVDYKLTTPRRGAELEAYEIQLRIYGQALAAAGFSGPLSAVLYFAGGREPYVHEVELAHPEPLAPHLERIHELWPLLMSTRPLSTNRPGPPPPLKH